jgi:hypothetical protein
MNHKEENIDDLRTESSSYKKGTGTGQWAYTLKITAGIPLNMKLLICDFLH